MNVTGYPLGSGVALFQCEIGVTADEGMICLNLRALAPDGLTMRSERRDTDELYRAVLVDQDDKTWDSAMMVKPGVMRPEPEPEPAEYAQEILRRVLAKEDVSPDDLQRAIDRLDELEPDDWDDPREYDL